MKFKPVIAYTRFATTDIMYKYGAVLQNYNKNGELVNDAIFTLIRSVFRDCEINSVILQPIILITLLKITENEYYPCKVRIQYFQCIQFIARI